MHIQALRLTKYNLINENKNKVKLGDMPRDIHILFKRNQKTKNGVQRNS